MSRPTNSLRKHRGRAIQSWRPLRTNPEHERGNEVTDSRKSPGGVAWIRKRIRLPRGGRGKAAVVPSEVPTSWLFYDFEVGKAILKRKHKKESSKVAEAILDSLALFYRTQALNIRIIGHATKSGSAWNNKSLAIARAGAVRLLLFNNGVPSIWLKAPEISDQLHLGPQGNKYKRMASRSAQVILPTAFLLPPIVPFTPPLRARMEEKLKTHCEKLPIKTATQRTKVLLCKTSFRPFSLWVLKNWDYLVDSRYCWDAGPGDVFKVQSNGLFFNLPETLTPWQILMRPEQAFTYLYRLHEDFVAARNRYFRNYAPPASFAGALYWQIAYTQSLRWWCLDKLTTGFGSAFTQINTVKRNAIKLHKLVKEGHYCKESEKPAQKFEQINKYLREQKIPCRVSGDSTHPKWTND